MTLHDLRRRLVSSLMMALCTVSVLLALVPLFVILFYVVSRGMTAVDWNFFTQLPKPHGETGGGMANAIYGTVQMCGIAALIAVPVGLLGGVFVAEQRHSHLATAVRFAADTLNGVPSIVIGLFVYALVVMPMKQYSALAGGIALGVMMIPIVTRTTEELLLLVPASMREGALALGATHSRAVLSVVLPAALPGVLTGIMLALARIAGETAPLLFTALNNRYWSTSLTQPMASLTVQVYNYAQSPYDDLHRQAWAGALVLVGLVLTCSILARLASRRLNRMRAGA
jgi:phosphate transport system permease protein